MTENQNRQPAGVPTGGQFAATAHAESDVALTGPQPPRVGPSQWGLGHATLALNGWGDKTLCADAVNEAYDALPAEERDRLGYLVLSEMNDYNGSYYTAEMYDRDGEFLDGSVIVPGGTFTNNGAPDVFRPTGDLPGEDLSGLEDWQRGYVIDVAAVRDFAWDAEQTKVREAVAFDAIDRSWQHLVLSPSVIRDQIDEELEDGEFLGREGYDEVLRHYAGVENDFDNVADTFHGAVRAAIEKVLYDR